MNDSDLPNSVFNNNRPQLKNIIITPFEVKSVLHTLKLEKASGPDQVNNILLKGALQ